MKITTTGFKTCRPANNHWLQQAPVATKHRLQETHWLTRRPMNYKPPASKPAGLQINKTPASRNPQAYKKTDAAKWNSLVVGPKPLPTSRECQMQRNASRPADRAVSSSKQKPESSQSRHPGRSAPFSRLQHADGRQMARRFHPAPKRVRSLFRLSRRCGQFLHRDRLRQRKKSDAVG